MVFSTTCEIIMVPNDSTTLILLAANIYLFCANNVLIR